VRYPVVWAKLNKYIAFGCGFIILIIAALSLMESVLRTFFNAPTVWSSDISLYIFIWAMFLGSAYSFQEHGHVAVDLIRDIVQRISGKKPRRIMSVIGYAVTAFTVVVMLYAISIMLEYAIRINQLTVALIQIPVAVSDMAMFIGTIFMLVTLVFIILDLFAGGDKYL